MLRTATEKLGERSTQTANSLQLTLGKKRAITLDDQSILPQPRKLPLTKVYQALGGAIRTLGPGIITGAADDDPSGIATYSSVGAQFGFCMLWTMPLTYPFMTGIQEICARLGRVTGKGIATIDEARTFGREEERIRIFKIFHDQVSQKLLAAIFEVNRVKEELESKGLKQESDSVSRASAKLIETIDTLLGELDSDKPESNNAGQN